MDDPKIAALICKYGFLGYGWWWATIELLRQQPNYKYPVGKYTFDAFAKRMQCERDATINFINDCCHEFADDKGALLCMDDNYLWSESLIRRMSDLDKRRESARNSALARWKKGECESNANAMPSQCAPNALKESKVNNKYIYCAFFDQVWSLYPNKKGKGQVSDTKKEKLYKIGIEQLTKCIERYKAAKPDWQQYQNGSTFFNSGYVDYLDENFKENEKPTSPPSQYRRVD